MNFRLVRYALLAPFLSVVATTGTYVLNLPTVKAASERASEPRDRSEPSKRRARARVGESEGRSPSVEDAESFRPFKLKTLEGTQRTLSDLLGKATVVVFFFPTCKYCNAAFPEIQKLYDSYKNRGLSMVWINIVPEENSLIKNWQSTHGYTVPVLLGGKSVQNDYKLDETPTHYLLDARGQIVSKHSGYKAGDEKILEREIQQALQ